MRVERYQYRRKSKLPLNKVGCWVIAGGMGLLICLFLSMFMVALPSIVLRIAGFDALGQTSQLLDNSAQSQIAPTLLNGQAVEQVVISAGGLGQTTISGNTSSYTVVVGTSDTGIPLAQAQIDEAGMITLCQQFSTMCSSNSNPVRNAHFDFRPGGMVVIADVFISQLNLWQTLNMVMQLNASNHLDIVGVDIGGMLYDLPSAQFGDVARQAEQIANQALQALAIQANGAVYDLAEVVITDTHLIATFR
jgi:hypothetical protein